MLILVAFYDTYELRWGYSLLPATTQGVSGLNKGKLTETLLHSRYRGRLKLQCRKRRKAEGKGKIVPVLNKVPAMKKYPVLN
jgi:hypothetical protein